MDCLTYFVYKDQTKQFEKKNVAKYLKKKFDRLENVDEKVLKERLKVLFFQNFTMIL